MHTLADFRQAADLTRDDVCVAAGLKRRTYANYESGFTLPDVSSAKRIAKALRRTIAEVVSACETAAAAYRAAHPGGTAAKEKKAG